MVKFSFIEIKNIEKLFSYNESTSELFGDEVNITEEISKVEDYINGILERLKLDKVISSYIYIGEIGRIAKYCYELNSNERLIQLSITLDTVSEKHYMEIEMTSSIVDGYDFDFEKLKIAMKELMIKDWNKCIWIRDEQSEELASELYTKMHIVENIFRELVNKVLIRELGTSWLDMAEFRKINDVYKARSVDFKRKVKSFNNIDDSLISINTDSLVHIMETVIFEDEINIDSEIQSTINLKSKILESNVNLFKSLKLLCKVKVDLWKDVFEKFTL